jgi:hypothetical protein
MSYLDSSNFSARFRHNIFQIPIYNFKDTNYSILNIKTKKYFHYYLIICIYSNNFIIQIINNCDIVTKVNMIDMILLSPRYNYLFGNLLG